jgi:hypothetical protein
MLTVHERSLYEVEQTMRQEQLAVLTDRVHRGIEAGRWTPPAVSDAGL